MANIAVLGTGLLGSAFAEAAAKRGDTVSAWNRSPEKAQVLAQFGVRAAATAADAVRGASRIHLILKDDAVVEAVLAAARPGIAADAVILDHSTTLPKRTVERARRYEAEGLKYLHCPVFMGPPAARNAQGAMMVAGSQAVFESVKTALAKMTGRLEYVGERADLAALRKLFGNAMIIGAAALVADILSMARNSGVEAVEAIKLLGLIDLNTIVAGRGTNMAAGNFAPSFELAMARKDIGLMLETAGEMPLAVLPGVAERMDQLIAAGHGAEDAAVLGVDAVRKAT